MALIQIKSISRRDALKSITSAAALLGSGGLAMEAGPQIHHQVEQEKRTTGFYKPKVFTERDYGTIKRLAELIIPADEISGSAVDAGAPEFIDLLASQNETLADIYTGGLAWLDAHARIQRKATFVQLSAQEQIVMLHEIVQATEEHLRHTSSSYQNSVYPDFRGYGVYREGNLAPGVVFFDWVRKMVVDAFYTSSIGIKDVGFMGNKVLSKYNVPEEVIQYALAHSPFAQ
jgi:gluconate 2-dehydrogenase gamma chain